MEYTYFIKSLVGTYAMVKYDDFSDFLNVLELLHPDVVVTSIEREIANHKYNITTYYINDNDVARSIHDLEYIPFS